MKVRSEFNNSACDPLLAALAYTCYQNLLGKNRLHGAKAGGLYTLWGWQDWRVIKAEPTLVQSLLWPRKKIWGSTVKNGHIEDGCIFRLCQNKSYNMSMQQQIHVSISSARLSIVSQFLFCTLTETNTAWSQVTWLKSLRDIKPNTLQWN